MLLDQAQAGLGRRRLDQHRLGSCQQLGHGEGVHLRRVVERQGRERRSPGPKSRATMQLRYSASRPRLVIMAPFGAAVVPDV